MCIAMRSFTLNWISTFILGHFEIDFEPSYCIVFQLLHIKVSTQCNIKVQQVEHFDHELKISVFQINVYKGWNSYFAKAN
jgi:hypothetical protein